jgi:hypothetical protein
VGLDVGVADPESGGLRASPQASFLSDGYYWFLYPLIDRLRKSHGKYIDLYGETEFRLGELAPLRRFLDDAEALIKPQPTRWRVHIGTQTEPTKRELHAAVERVEFEALIAQLRGIVAEAEASRSSVLFIGD